MTNTPEDNDIRLLFKVRESVLTTLKDRGYDIPEGYFKLSFEDFQVLLNKEHHHLYFPNLEPIGLKEEYKRGGGILVYFEPVDRLDLKIFKTRVAQIEKEYPDLNKLYIVIKTYGNSKKLSNFVKTELVKHPNVEILENIYPFDIMKNKSMAIVLCYVGGLSLMFTGAYLIRPAYAFLLVGFLVWLDLFVGSFKQ